MTLNTKTMLLVQLCHTNV